MRLAIITTHPIQYYAPIFKLLNKRGNIEIKVFYTLGDASINKYDKDFKRTINWDIPLLEGYPYVLVKNTSKDPGSHHFKGIINPDLITILKIYKPDSILIYGWAYQSHLKLMRYFNNKIPVYFRGDSTLLDEIVNFKYVLKSFFLKWIYSYVDYSFYVGTNNKSYFKKYGLKENQLVFAPHAVDNARFAVKRSSEVYDLRKNLNVTNGDILLLFVGKFEDKKDPLSLLKAFLKMNINNVHLLFVGNGALENILKKEARGNNNVHFMNFQNQSYIPVIYQSCDIFCLPSKGPAETWGLAVNEAMACQKAILVSDKVGCTVDLVQPGYNGYIFKAGDLSDLLVNLTKIVTKTNIELAGMGKNSVKIIKSWSFENQVKNIELFLNEK